MPDETGEESAGDLTARLQQLEERLRGEGGATPPARRRRTPVRDVPRLVLPPDDLIPVDSEPVTPEPAAPPATAPAAPPATPPITTAAAVEKPAKAAKASRAPRTAKPAPAPPPVPKALSTAPAKAAAKKAPARTAKKAPAALPEVAVEPVLEAAVESEPTAAPAPVERRRLEPHRPTPRTVAPRSAGRGLRPGTGSRPTPPADEPATASEPVAEPISAPTERPVPARPTPRSSRRTPRALPTPAPVVPPVTEPVTEQPSAAAGLASAGRRRAAVPVAAPEEPSAAAGLASAGRRRAAVPVAAPEQPVARAPRTLPALPPPAATPLPVHRSAVADPVVRFLAVLAVLLLALAAGLGTAALIEHRQATFESDVVVRLDPGPAPTTSAADELTAGFTRYLRFTAGGDFTKNAVTRAGVSTSDSRVDVAGVRVAPRQLQLVVHASTASAAKKLSVAAGDALVELVNEDQAGNVTAAGDRLTAVVVKPATVPLKTAPKASTAAVDGALAGGAVFVLVGVGAALRLNRRQ